MNLKKLIGSGDRIGLVTAPFLIAGVILNIAFPSFFAVGGPPAWLAAVSVAVLAVGMVAWGWSVALILVNVPRGRLITTGPYALVKHPLYTAVALLVLPWLGFLFDTWLGAAIGLVLYVGSRMFEPSEEAELAKAFDGSWDRYRSAVKLRWL